MDTIINQIAEQEDFDAFISENMRLSSYTPLWVNEVTDTEYSASGNFSTITADYGVAMIASIIEKNADKPLMDNKTIGEITGKVGRMGDRFQLDNDRLKQLLEMEDRFRRRTANFSETQKKTEYLKIVRFLFDNYENAAIAPHKRLDFLTYEGISKGTMTINIANNPNGVNYGVIDLGVKMYGVQGPVFSAANSGTMKVLETFQYVCKAMKAIGKPVQKIRMNGDQFSTIVLSNQFNSSVKMTVGSMEVSPAGMLSLPNVNNYLRALSLPPIEIIDEFVKLPSGTVQNIWADNRITFQCTPKVSKMMISDPLETQIKLPNRVYSSYLDNLISQYVTERGRFIEYEMQGIPVFSNTDYCILKTDEVQP